MSLCFFLLYAMMCGSRATKFPLLAALVLLLLLFALAIDNFASNQKHTWGWVDRLTVWFCVVDVFHVLCSKAFQLARILRAIVHSSSMEFWTPRRILCERIWFERFCWHRIASDGVDHLTTATHLGNRRPCILLEWKRFVRIFSRFV